VDQVCQAAPPAVAPCALRTRLAVYAVLSVALALSWQAFTVFRNYGGNWTALFCVGEKMGAPAELDYLYRFRNSKGFDGAYYYLIAIDPLARTRIAAGVEYPGLRFRRILVPALAHMVAFGRLRWIAPAYIGVNLLFLFAGVWWCGEILRRRGVHQGWGLLFLAIPATPISLDRLTVDMAFTALAVGCVWAWDSGRRWLLVTMLALTCLTRETGLVVVAAFAVHYAWKRCWREVAWVAAAAAPFLLWSLHVNASHPPEFRYWAPTAPFIDTLRFLRSAPAYHFSPMVNGLARGFDLLALAGIVAAFWYARPRRDFWRDPLAVTATLFMLLGVYLFALEEWTHVYDFGRVLSPMLACLALQAVAARRWAVLGAIAAISLRVAVQIAPQLLGAIRL